MKKVCSLIILSIVVVMTLLICSNGVKASTLLFPTSNDTENEVENETEDENEVEEENETENSLVVNNLNNNLTKENHVNITNTPSNNTNLPQTGENDFYIVTGVGFVAVVIGSVAYIKSRKYDI